ncbi:hypothetical protein [uncultured Tolumonas sp.]|uniref:hypothetical protein n=1 Tax=uncultured Tolumonas sp. TaxID=263765 RepID=UPI002A0A9F05|nr:hypothetical protein [uncultured Tolumonas sp.]
MPISHSDLKDCLKQLECRTVHQTKQLIEYMLPGTKFAFYLQVENLFPQMILPPALEVFRDVLVSVPGVTIKYQYYHNADMTRFPKHAHGGKKEVHYGLAFEFENSDAVSLFVKKLVEIVS